jgi:hypothetical protein
MDMRVIFMKRDDVIHLFSNQSHMAQVCGVSKQRVCVWKERIPAKYDDQMQAYLDGEPVPAHIVRPEGRPKGWKRPDSAKPFGRKKGYKMPPKSTTPLLDSLLER